MQYQNTNVFKNSMICKSVWID